MSVPEIEDNEDMPKPVKGNTDEFDKKTQMYLDERKMLVDAEQAQAQSFDKGILTLSAGALGLSIAFIKDVNPQIASCSEWWIIFSWGYYIFSITATLSSFLTSQKALRRQCEILENKGGNDNENQWAKCTEMLNWMSIFFFIMGTFSMLVFAGLNLR